MRPIVSIIALLTAVFAGCDRDGPAAPAEPPAPAAIETALDAANTYLDAGQLDRAEAVALKLVERAPADIRARELLALVLVARASAAASQGAAEVARGLFEDAYEQYRAAVDLAPGDPDYHQSAGEVAQAAGRLDDALEHYLAAGRLAPAEPKHALYEGMLRITRGELRQGRATLERVIELDPDEAIAHLSLATIALREDRLDDALAHVREARAIDPADASFRIQEAIVRRRLGEPRLGLELLLGLDPSLRVEEAVTSEMAACWSAIGEPARAAEAWEARRRARPSDPRDPYSALAAASAWIEAGDPKRAAFHLEDAAAMLGETEEVRRLRERLSAE